MIKADNRGDMCKNRCIKNLMQFIQVSGIRNFQNSTDQSNHTIKPASNVSPLQMSWGQIAHCSVYICLLFIITDGNFNDWQQSAQNKRRTIQLLWQTVKVMEKVYKKTGKIKQLKICSFVSQQVAISQVTKKHKNKQMKPLCIRRC